MMSVLAYVRNILGWTDDDPVIRTSFKRDRGDDFSDEELSPAGKRLKQLRKSTFPVNMADNDTWYKQERPARNVRYVPIEVEADHPSTSTPIDISDRLGRVRTVPINVSERSDRERTVPINLSERWNRVRTVPTKSFSENGPSTPARKPRMHTPVQPVTHAVIDDEDEDDPDVCLVKSKTEKPKKTSKVYINLDDDENDAEHDDDEVIFVKKVTSPYPANPYQYFVARNQDVRDSRDQYYRFSRRSSERSSSPRKFNKFKEPPGIIKSYKRQPNCLSKWMQTQKPANLSQTRSGYLSHNGNARSTLTELYNLNEKKNYQELINKFSATTRPLNVLKPWEVMNIAKDSASFRMTRLSQKQALNEIHFAEKSIAADRENGSKEYDPITVASINSSDSEIEIVPSESSTSSVRIDPVNSLKESYKGKPVTSEEWLANLNSKYRRKRQETQEKLKDVRRESDIISKVNYEQKLAHLEHKLKHELSIPESLIEEPQPTVELPTLTPEQEKLVNRALGPGPPGQLLVEKFNLRIHRRDLQTLAGLNWLNDEVINFYMNLLMQRSGERPDLPKVYAANTFFYPKLMQSGQAGLRRWTRKVDIFAHDLMVVPVHLGVHWCLSLVDFRERRVQYLDSMGGRNQPCLDALLQYLRDEHQDKKSRPFDDSGWKAECISKEIPQQMNGSDCGMFACTFAEFAARGAPYAFTQAHMPALRRKAALEILLGKLLL